MIMRPDADLSNANWVNENGVNNNDLYLSIGGNYNPPPSQPSGLDFDPDIFSDLKYIRTTVTPGITRTYICSLSNPVRPFGTSGTHQCHVRYRVTGRSDDTVSLTFNIVETGASIVRGTLSKNETNMLTSFGSEFFTVSSISDYTDLRFRVQIVTTKVGGNDTITLDVSWSSLEIPNLMMINNGSQLLGFGDQILAIGGPPPALP